MRYVGRAFMFHWNLLMFFGGAAFGFVSGRPDVVLPLAFAAELMYLAALSTNPRFQNWVDAVDGAHPRPVRRKVTPDTVRSLLRELSAEDRRRFERLQSLCTDLYHIAEGVKGGAGSTDSLGIEDMKFDNINRLIWIYLKLLYSKKLLENFFGATGEDEIKSGVQRIRQRLEALGPEAEDTHKEARHRKSLMDTLKTLEMRLENYQKTKDNYDYILLELERLYSKIAGIAEMGVNRQDPNFVTSEIDIVSSSVMQTEKAMDDLKYITGFSFQDDEPPSILNPGRRQREAQRN